LAATKNPRDISLEDPRSRGAQLAGRSVMTFANRFDAGRQLGALFIHHPPANPIVIGISRGGVPVAAEIAHMLQAPLEICVVRKLFSPGSPAFAIGAVAEYGAVYLDDTEIAKLRLSPADVKQAITFESLEVVRLGELLRDLDAQPFRGRDAILVDDAVTTVDTIHAAARSVRAQMPATLTLAVPLGNAALLERLGPDFDRIVCLRPEEGLVAAGMRYRDFAAVSENEVTALLSATRSRAERARRGLAARPSP
jgi:predicted phosphoribosyltransferase